MTRAAAGLRPRAMTRQYGTDQYCNHPDRFDEFCYRLDFSSAFQWRFRVCAIEQTCSCILFKGSRVV